MKLHLLPSRPKGLLESVRALLAAAAAGLALTACGGDGIGSGGTGATTGQAVGTVDGFGSVFVGGVRCDDTRAGTDRNTPEGAPDSGRPEVRLGQRVRVVYDAASLTCVARSISVDAEVVGRVTSLAPLVVAGQRITIVTDPAIAPPTVFEGLADASEIRLGDRLEVHGERITVSGITSIQATRIERRPLAEDWVRVRGVIANLAGSQFTIGGLTVRTDASTRLDPPTLVLANGQTVIVWSTAPAAADGSITARYVRLARRTMLDRESLRLDGLVAGCTATPCTTPTVDGLAIDFSGATFVHGGAADIANGVWVRVEGQWNEARAVVVASRASVRRRDAAALEVTLIGVVTDFTSNEQFSVRGVPVAANASTVFEAGCSVAEGTIVTVRGRIEGNRVLASRVDCPSLAEGFTVDVLGAIQELDPAAKTFKIATGPFRAYTFYWDDATVFGGSLTPAGLTNGMHVALRSVLVEGRFLIKRIHADPRPVPPPGVLLFSTYGVARDVTATSLAVNTIQMSIVPGITVLNGDIVSGARVRAWFYRTALLQPWIALQVNRLDGD